MLWWGYIHINGSIQVKRFFDQADIDDANDSDFVEKTFRPFEARSREDAIEHIKRLQNPVF